MPSLTEIAKTSGIDDRQLRYVLDHRLVPGSESASRGRGATRSLAPVEAFGLVLAATLLRAKLKRETVEDCMRCLARPSEMANGHTLLRQLYELEGPSRPRLEIADGCHLRVVTRRPRSGDSVVVGWKPLGEVTVLEADHEPRVKISVDLFSIRLLTEPQNPSKTTRSGRRRERKNGT